MFSSIFMSFISINISRFDMIFCINFFTFISSSLITILPASNFASLSREITRDEIQSICLLMSSINSFLVFSSMSGLFWMLSIIILIDVSGVFSWCEMSVRELLKFVFSFSLFSAVSLNNTVVLYSSFLSFVNSSSPFSSIFSS